VSGVQVAELGKGGSFGEAAVMAATEAERTRTATVEAAEDEGLLSFITPRSRLYGESL
jgi:CRP-like cAMP-binding protein